MKKRSPLKPAAQIAKLTKQVEKLKRELAKYTPQFSDPQTGHDRPLSDAEKQFVAIMRQTQPKYCLPRASQHPNLKAWAAVPHYQGEGWKPMTKGVHADASE